MIIRIKLVKIKMDNAYRRIIIKLLPAVKVNLIIQQIRIVFTKINALIYMKIKIFVYLK